AVEGGVGPHRYRRGPAPLPGPLRGVGEQQPPGVDAVGRHRGTVHHVQVGGREAEQLPAAGGTVHHDALHPVRAAQRRGGLLDPPLFDQPADPAVRPGFFLHVELPPVGDRTPPTAPRPPRRPAARARAPPPAKTTIGLLCPARSSASASTEPSGANSPIGPGPRPPAAMRPPCATLRASASSSTRTGNAAATAWASGSAVNSSASRSRVAAWSMP